jgi:hypothetical protein
VDDASWLVLGGELLRWAPGGYTDRRPATGEATLLTPPTSLHVLEAGWRGSVPLLHPSSG